MAIDINVHSIKKVEIIALYKKPGNTIVVKIRTEDKYNEVNVFFKNTKELNDLLMFALVNFACGKSGKTDDSEK